MYKSRSKQGILMSKVGFWKWVTVVTMLVPFFNSARLLSTATQQDSTIDKVSVALMRISELPHKLEVPVLIVIYPVHVRGSLLD